MPIIFTENIVFAVDKKALAWATTFKWFWLGYCNIAMHFNSRRWTVFHLSYSANSWPVTQILRLGLERVILVYYQNRRVFQPKFYLNNFWKRHLSAKGISKEHFMFRFYKYFPRKSRFFVKNKKKLEAFGQSFDNFGGSNFLLKRSDKLLKCFAV